MSSQPSINSPTPVQSLRFLFAVYENQRWWMGLDWTAALLPGERPSWCSSSQHPLPPPNAFALPDNTTTYLPDGKGGRLKRTATWKWEEPEWRVVVHNGNGLSRVERPLPSLKDENNSSSRLLKAAGRLREPSLTSSSADSGTTNVDASSQDLKEIDEEPLTDADGWVYGDNKWEAQSNKGGMGKYTRYRKWTRVAVVFEEVETVPPGDLGIHKESSDQQESLAPVSEAVITTNPSDSLLKQRLRTALNKDKASDS
ncbi:integral peroxisomal membrane peroxin-domain-containing protein [Gymnopilus junonius]|uniref:Integral peroxisomal membrane peroxin-domain-containing protein n=1 Tax=Gymnopilus junonius TaxID=109634 RepID=A0A9P5TLR0_GYMJU|nr:integral peroxisomal membrane peroxin-domain-containing protein [Gymnopilus junonius]